jgi:hypothetical protein
MSSNEADASSASAQDAGKAFKGTGVFMPMVSRPATVHDRGSSGRSKPARRRNASTGSLQQQQHLAPARSTSSNNLGSRLTGQPQQQPELRQIKEVAFMSIQEEVANDSATPVDVQPARASTAFTGSDYSHQAVTAALTASATAGPFVPPPPPPLHLQLDFAGSSASLGLPQQVSLASTNGSPNIALAPNSSSLSKSSPFFAADPLVQVQVPPIRVALAADQAPTTAAAAAAAASLSSQAISTEALQTFFGSSGLQLPNVGAPGATSGSRDRVSLDMSSAARLSCLQSAANFNGSLLSLSSVNSPLPSPRSLASCVNLGTVQPTAGTVFGQPSFNKWAVADAIDSVQYPPDSSSACQNPVGDTEEQIQRRIDELVVMKKLLQMKQQHKQQLELLHQQQREQQQLLQMQQMQQQSLLQQQMLNAQAREASGSHVTDPTKFHTTTTALQRELLLQQQQLMTGQGNDSCDGHDLLQHLQRELLLQPLAAANQQQPQIQSSCNAASNLSLPDLQSMQHDLLLLQLQLQQAEGNMSSATSLPSCSLGLPAASTMSSLLPGPSGSLLGALQLPCTAAAGGAPRVSGLLPLVPAPAANSNCDLKLASSALFPDELMAANSLSSALDNSVAEH